MKVLLDGHGGDNAPLENVLGAIKAVKRNSSLQVFITGKIEEIIIQVILLLLLMLEKLLIMMTSQLLRLE